MEGSTKEYGHCRDCYKCIRACPLKAIEIAADRAVIVKQECLFEGMCSEVCPQGLLGWPDQWAEFLNLLGTRREVIVSLAPSYLGLRSDPYQFAAALYQLGVKRIEEAAWAVPEVSAQYWQAEQLNPAITSSCPAVVRLVETHFPSLIPHLVPVVSPTVLHARSIKKRYPQAAVVAITPCPAQKEEQKKFETDLSLSLTFREAFAGLATRDLDPLSLRPRRPDICGNATARQFSMPGGWQRSWQGEDIVGKLWTLSGFAECLDFLRALQTEGLDGQWAELLLCQGGCLGGAGWPDKDDVYTRQSRLMSRIISRREDKRPLWKPVDLTRTFHPQPVERQEAAEADIKRVLASTGKQKPHDQLDCGACGYDSCRDHARAVVLGKAVPEMCIPYMRLQAESLSRVIIDSTPNAIVVVDDRMEILAINPAGERMFGCQSSALTSQPLDRLFDPRDFQKVRDSRRTLVSNVVYPKYSLVLRQIIFPVEEQNIVIGIFSDITQERQQSEELSRLKTETLQRTREVIEKQMRVAQEIAGLLGETTAETKVLLSRLIDLIEHDEHTAEGGRPGAS